MSEARQLRPDRLTDHSGSQYPNLHRCRFPSVVLGKCSLQDDAQGTASVTELAQPVGISLTGMKMHLRVLEEAELVRTEKVGDPRLQP